MTQLTTSAAIQRFGENEERVDQFVNKNGFYMTNEALPRSVETLPSFMQRMVNRYLSFNVTGSWQTSFNYERQDLAKESGVTYICLEDHSSTVFLDDLNSGKWAVYQGLTTVLQGGTGAVSRMAHTKVLARVSPEDFGAPANMIDDDSPAIKKALDYLIALGGGELVFEHSKYRCNTKIGTFVNLANVTIFGYGVEIKNYSGNGALMTFGDGTLSGDRYTAYLTTVRNLKILGISFTSGSAFGSGTGGPTRWADQTPILVHTAKNVLVQHCYFENWDYAAVEFGAKCVDCLVDSCSFYSSQVDAGHANYAVRIFCYSTYSYIDGDLSPTNEATGVLKAGYTLPPETGNFGHENISVTNCYFQNVSHGVMVSAARRGIISNNRFVNCSTRSISLTTFSREYLCCNNTHSLNTTEQTSSGVSVFYGMGQATYRHQIQGDKFTVIGATNAATGFTPIKCYMNSHDWVIKDCTFYLPNFDLNGGRCISADSNSNGAVIGNHFYSPNIQHPVNFNLLAATTTPGYQTGKISIIGNTFEAFLAGAIWINNVISNTETIVIKDNIVYGNPTRFVAHTATDSGKIAKLFLSGNNFLGSPVRYIDNIVSANKAILLNQDIFEINTLLSTPGGVANPSTSAVTFDFSSFSVPACFTNGTKSYLFSAYGQRQNSQASTDFLFSITAETISSINGNIVRNAGSSLQIGNVALKIIFRPFNT